jgi:hypothetical protein
VSSTSDFILELVHAANTLEKQPPFERKRLIDHAVLIIIDMRETMELPPGAVHRAAITGLRAASDAVTFGHASDSQVKVALLEATGMIRELLVLLDTKT